MYLNKEGYVIESLHELLIWQAFIVMWEKIKSMIDDKVWDHMILEAHLE